MCIFEMFLNLQCISKQKMNRWIKLNNIEQALKCLNAKGEKEETNKISCFIFLFCYAKFIITFCNSDFYYSPVGTIIGAVVGGIAGLIFLCVIIVVVCIVCCKKKSTGTVIQPANVSTMSSTSNFRFRLISFIKIYLVTLHSFWIFFFKSTFDKLIYIYIQQ